MNIKKLAKKVEAALVQDNTILVPKDKLNETQGFTTEHMIYLGFAKYDLKYMERHGLAKRGYVRVRRGTNGAQFTQPRWVLIGETNEKV